LGFVRLFVCGGSVVLQTTEEKMICNLRSDLITGRRKRVLLEEEEWGRVLGIYLITIGGMDMAQVNKEDTDTRCYSGPDIAISQTSL
jgi:hypothetical protein